MSTDNLTLADFGVSVSEGGPEPAEKPDFEEQLTERERELKERWGCTPDEFEARAKSHHLGDNGERESFCEECGNRVTETLDGTTVGHKYGERSGEEECPVRGER